MLWPGGNTLSVIEELLEIGHAPASETSLGRRHTFMSFSPGDGAIFSSSPLQPSYLTSGGEGSYEALGRAQPGTQDH